MWVFTINGLVFADGIALTNRSSGTAFTLVERPNEGAKNTCVEFVFEQRAVLIGRTGMNPQAGAQEDAKPSIETL